MKDSPISGTKYGTNLSITMLQRWSMLERKKKLVFRKRRSVKSKQEKNRRQSVLDSLVTNGKDSLRSFAPTDSIDFYEKEAKQSIMVLWLLPQNPTLRFALHKEQNLQLKDFSRAWIGMVVATIGENVSHTGQNSLLPMRLFIPNPSFRTSFRSLITCRAAQIHTFHSVAPMVVLTNSRTGMARRKLDWGYRLKGKRKDKPDSCT